MGMPNGVVVPPGGQPPAEDAQGPTKVTEAIRSIVGLLVAGFAGALNFIGLKNGEVPVVLRNEARTPTLILCLIVAAILTAVASIFVSTKWSVSFLAWLATACALVATVALTIQLTKIPGIPSEQLVSLSVITWWFGIAAVVLFVMAAIFGNWTKESNRGKFIHKVMGTFTVPAQALLVFAAVALTATATYGALRAETVSQLSNTSVELSATISETGRTASMVLSIDAAKMQSGDRVNVLVAGLRRQKNLAKFCKKTPIKANLPCSWAPCFTRASFMSYLHLPHGCDAISSGIYQPNAAGTVQQTVTIPVSDVRYRGLELIGLECVVSDPGKSCTYGTTDPNITRVDIQIPKDTAS